MEREQIVGIVLAFGVIISIIGIIKITTLLVDYFKVRNPMEPEKEHIREEALEECEKETGYSFCLAKIVRKRKYVYNKMAWAVLMRAQFVEENYITFLLDSGEEKEYLVPEMLFDNVVENEEGTLITLNGNFFDFGEGIGVVEDDTACQKEETRRENTENNL